MDNGHRTLEAAITALNESARRAIDTAAAHAKVTSAIRSNNFHLDASDYYWLHRTEAPMEHVHDVHHALLLARFPASPESSPTTHEPPPIPEDLPETQIRERNDLFRSTLILSTHVRRTWHVYATDYEHDDIRYTWLHVDTSDLRLPFHRLDAAHALLITRTSVSSGRQRRRLRALFSIPMLSPHRNTRPH